MVRIRYVNLFATLPLCSYPFQYFFNIKLDGKLISRKRNNRPTVFEDVLVYAADPWYQTTDGKIMKLTILKKKPSESNENEFSPLTSKKYSIQQATLKGNK